MLLEVKKTVILGEGEYEWVFSEKTANILFLNLSVGERVQFVKIH